MFYERFIKKAIETALSDTPCLLLTGPRQSGKTTLVNKWNTSSRNLSFDNWSLLHQAKNDPENFIEGLVAANPNQLVILDEIQHVPELFLPIKRIIDQNRRPGMFLLTGSANLLSWAKTPDSLVGRIEYSSLYPLSLLEIMEKKTIWLENFFASESNFLASLDQQFDPQKDRNISFFADKGGFPEAFKREEKGRRDKWFEAYLKGLLEKDIYALSNIDQPLLLHNLLHHIAYRCSSTVNFTDLATKLQCSVITLKKYFSLLQMMFLVCPLPAWHRNRGKRLVKAPKVYLIDSGLLCYLLQADSTDLNLHGILFEQFIFNELQKQISWMNESLNLSHWRTADGKEVDFIVANRKGRVVGIEVKAKVTLTSSDWASLKLLETEVGADFLRGIVIYKGKELLPLSPNLWAVPISSLY